MPFAPRVVVLHENPQWLPPFAAALDAEGVPWQEWALTGGSIDLDDEPEPHVYWSRLSASGHTRGHAATKDQGRAVLRWLESWGRTVVNGSAVLELEMSKVAQHAALRAAGVDVPRTTAAFGRDAVIPAASEFEAPFITKHNQGGKGLGVRRFDSHDELAAWVHGEDFDPSPDGTTLVQELLRTREPLITRFEFVDGELVYAVRVDTSAGSFQLCPAEACEVPGGRAPFELRPEVTADHPLVVAHQRFLAAAGIGVAGLEFAETVDGRLVTYDVNTNTNYNPQVEMAATRSGPRQVARYLARLLAELDPSRPSSSPTRRGVDTR